MDDFSKKIESRFKEEFPEWVKYCSTVSPNGEPFLVIKIPRPNDIGKPDLELETCNDEVTVFFGPYHIHCDDFGDNDAYDDALLFVKQIVSEQSVIVSYWHKDSWCGSNLVKVVDIPKDNSEYPYADTIKIYSWTGKQDVHIGCCPKA